MFELGIALVVICTIVIGVVLVDNDAPTFARVFSTIFLLFLTGNSIIGMSHQIGLNEGRMIDATGNKVNATLPTVLVSDEKGNVYRVKMNQTISSITRVKKIGNNYVEFVTVESHFIDKVN